MPSKWKVAAVICALGLYALALAVVVDFARDEPADLPVDAIPHEGPRP